jgi:hypothetical protein
MSATTDGKVVDPESVRWIEEGTSRQDDEEYFAGAWQRALKDARADVTAAGSIGTLSKVPEISRLSPDASGTATRNLSALKLQITSQTQSPLVNGNLADRRQRKEHPSAAIRRYFTWRTLRARRMS